MIVRNYGDGKWRASCSNESIDVTNPATAEGLATCWECERR